MTFKVPEKNRIILGPMRSQESDGNNGAFHTFSHGHVMNIIASDGGGWEHVSVSFQHRCPTWEEMCRVKNMFWDKEDCVIQYHPAEKDYVNNHPYCLHLWRPINTEFPTPPTIMVGLK